MVHGGTGTADDRPRPGRHRAPEPAEPPEPAEVPGPVPVDVRPAPAGEPVRPGRWLAWMLTGFVVVGGGLVAGYASLGDDAAFGDDGGSGATTPLPSAQESRRPGPDLPAPVVPPCDGSYVLVVGSVTTPVGYQEAVVRLLEDTPGAHWFTTEGTCGSLRGRSDDGTLIHTVYLGPFPTAEAALASCPAGPPDAYAKRLDDGAGAAGSTVTCG